MNKFFLSFLIIALLAHYKDQSFRWLNWFAVINFSVFFLHTYANAGLKIIFTGAPAQSLPIPGNIFYQFIYFSVVVAICIGATLLIRKVLGKNSKYVIGAA
jgi:hypothetical protein